MNKKSIITAFAIVIIIIGIGYLFNRTTDNNYAILGEDHRNDERVESYEIYPGDVAEKIKNNEDFVLLDVRTPEEYKKNHLKNSILLPIQELSQDSLNEIGLGEEMKNKEIIIYCRSGSRSKNAYDVMNSLGYINIKSVAGGMIHWEEDNYPFIEPGDYDGSQTVTNNNSEVVKNTPQITIDKTFHDFGLVQQYGGKVSKNFTIKNTGNSILEIGDVSTSCSCTSATISSKSIQSGEVATLTVIFDPNLHEEPVGVFKRTVFIPTNDPTKLEAEIVIQVDIEEGK